MPLSADAGTPLRDVAAQVTNFQYPGIDAPRGSEAGANPLLVWCTFMAVPAQLLRHPVGALANRTVLRVTRLRGAGAGTARSTSFRFSTISRVTVGPDDGDDITDGAGRIRRRRKGCRQSRIVPIRRQLWRATPRQQGPVRPDPLEVQPCLRGSDRHRFRAERDVVWTPHAIATTTRPISQAPDRRYLALWIAPVSDATPPAKNADKIKAA